MEKSSRTNYDSLPTHTLVEQAAAGDRGAVETLCQRLRPRLVTWARGRLPPHARDLRETEDLVQEALVGSIRRLPGLEIEQGAGFLNYLKTALLNRIRNEVRNAQRKHKHVELDSGIQDRAPLPIDLYLGKEAEGRYTRALAQLRPAEQDLVIARVELQMSAEEIALHTGKPSASAARMATRRAILKLARLLGEDGAEGLEDKRQNEL